MTLFILHHKVIFTYEQEQLNISVLISPFLGARKLLEAKEQKIKRRKKIAY